MKKSISMLAILGALSSPAVMAQDLDIKVTNLTNAMYFTPILAAAHDATTHLYVAGTAASISLQAQAEGGDYSGLSSDVQGLGANVIENPAAGLLNPGASTSFSMTSNASNNYFSLTSMMLPTNDGFVGADSIHVPAAAGTYSYFINAYDAGTEANNEVINGGGTPGVLGIPQDPGVSMNTGGTGVTVTEDNTNVHIHRGIQGDNNATGGTSDLTNNVHRWLNPVAKLIITVN